MQRVPGNGLAPETDLRSAIPLGIVIPERDSVYLEQSRHRIAAHTCPKARAFINGKETHVYESGAFVGMVELMPGENSVTIKVMAQDGEYRSRKLFFFRTPPPATTPPYPLQIDRGSMLPDVSIEFSRGDELTAEFKGSSGHQAYFSLGHFIQEIPMQEVPASQTGGTGGIYRAVYRLTGDERVLEAPLIFTLRDSEGNEISDTTTSRFTIIADAFPRVAEIRSSRAFLLQDIQTDRLGGIRLGYLQPGARIIVSGRHGPHYRVELSGKKQAWLPAQFASLLPPETSLPQSATGSMSITAQDSHDKVILSLGERLPYLSRMLSHPNRIEIDLYGAQSATRLISRDSLASGIRDIQWEQVEPGHFRLVIYTAHDIHWGYHIRYGIGSSLIVQIQRPPNRSKNPDLPLKGKHIVLDAGHGGSNYGALGATGVLEKDIVLPIADMIHRQLVGLGARVTMTRETDSDVSLTSRSETIISSDAHVLVSIHANSIGISTDPLRVRGTASYYHFHAFRPLAHSIHHRMLELPLHNFGLIGQFNFSLNLLNELPNVLVETAFLSHPEEEMMLTDPAFREEIAGKITSGLVDFFQRYTPE